MALAARLGIAPRRLWGWEPARVETHEHDDAGRVVRTVVTTEAEWDTDSYELVAALADVEADECPGCGQALSETTAWEYDPDNPRRTGEWRSAPPHRCQGCSAISRQSEQHKDAPHARALRFPVRLVEVIPRGGAGG